MTLLWLLVVMITLFIALEFPQEKPYGHLKPKTMNGVPTIYDRKYVVVGGCDFVLYVINLEDGNLVRSAS